MNQTQNIKIKCVTDQIKQSVTNNYYTIIFD